MKVNSKFFGSLVVVTVFLLSGHVMGTESPADLQGFSQVNKNLQDRLFSADVPNPFSLGRYIGGSNIGKLMGYYQGNGLTSGFYNSQPNATNMLLWYLAFEGLSTDLSKICQKPEQTSENPSGVILQLNDFYKSKLQGLCAWPETQSRNETALSALWLATMSYDAPQEEYDAWKAFLLSDEFLHVNSEAAIKAMLKSIFLNPYFLLRQ